MSDDSLTSLNPETPDFNGELVISSQTAPCTGTRGSRWLDLLLYKFPEGGFAAGIKFCTNIPGEEGVARFERMDEAIDVESFFFAFEPHEYLRNASLSEPLEVSDQIAADLYRKYEIAVRDVLGAAAQFKEARRDAVKEPAPTYSPKG